MRIDHKEEVSFDQIDKDLQKDIETYFNLYNGSFFCFQESSSISSLSLRKIMDITQILLDEVDQSEEEDEIVKRLQKIDLTAMYTFHLLNNNAFEAKLRPIKAENDESSPLGEVNSEELEILKNLTLKLVQPLLDYEPNPLIVMGMAMRPELDLDHLVIGFESGKLGAILGRIPIDCLLKYINEYSPETGKEEKKYFEDIKEKITGKAFNSLPEDFLNEED